MRRRPQVNQRRSVIRAIGAVIVLVVLLVIAIFVVSSLTAPSVKAPTPPNTPGPPATAVVPTGAPAFGKTPAAKPPKATPAKRLGLGTPNDNGVMEEDRPHRLIGRAFASRRPGNINASPAPDGRSKAFFHPAGSAYAPSPLYVSESNGRVSRVGVGDSFVRPVWSPESRYLLYTRVRSSHVFPGTVWSLIRVDLHSLVSTIVASADAMNLTPLGWSRGRLLYLVANTTDTGIYQIVHGRSSLLSILMPQPLTTASLSPNGRFIAFGAPTNCFFCTLEMYDLTRAHVWLGPSGMPTETSFAWIRNSSSLVADTGSSLVVVDSTSGQVAGEYRMPSALPRAWIHPIVAMISRDSLHLEDLVTHVRYTALPRRH